MFNKAMTVMMIGLVAMLGVKAEAHWIVIKGNCYWHSGECVRQDGEGEKEPIPDPISKESPLGELVLMPEQIEVVCPSNRERDRVQNVELSNTGLALIAKRAIVQSDVTNAFDRHGEIGKNVEWPIVGSFATFLENGCPGGAPAQNVIVRRMSVQMNLYLNGGKQPHSAWTATCTLPKEFKLPKKPPDRGVAFDCFNISTCHGDQCLNP